MPNDRGEGANGQGGGRFVNRPYKDAGRREGQAPPLRVSPKGAEGPGDFSPACGLVRKRRLYG